MFCELEVVWDIKTYRVVEESKRKSTKVDERGLSTPETEWCCVGERWS